jgi:hypothetical protein
MKGFTWEITGTSCNLLEPIFVIIQNPNIENKAIWDI